MVAQEDGVIGLLYSQRRTGADVRWMRAGMVKVETPEVVRYFESSPALPRHVGTVSSLSEQYAAVSQS